MEFRIAIVSIFFILLFCAETPIMATPAALQRPEGFPFTEFNKARDEKFFSFLGDQASIYAGALQLTPDSSNEGVFSHYNKSGRIMYEKLFKLWLDEKQSKQDEVLASFSTYFVINIYREGGWESGEGLAFLIAPDLTIPASSSGHWLGLTNASTDGNPENHIVAVEFDTEEQETVNDPNGNHLGLNINSVISNKTVSLDKHNITISPVNGTNYSVWIDYKGTERLIEVYMERERKPRTPKPEKPILKENLNLKHFLKQESYFGFAASTGQPQIQLNCVLQWDLEVEVLPIKKDRKWLKIGLGIGIPALMVILCAVYFCFVYLKKRRRDEESNVLEYLKRLPGVPREFKYKELRKASKGFNEGMKLGQGGFGTVFKGVLVDEDGQKFTEIAVKRFMRNNVKGVEEFLAEITIIHRLQHKHLVPLVGWCYEKGKLLLVYDFMPNGSLDKHLYAPSNSPTLSWNHRCKILAGVASALHYLHAEFHQKVVHRDIKSSNIMLDVEFNARLGDFGLARALENEKNSYADLASGIPGTMGYVAPECFHTGKATPVSDVFGFGAVVLEVVCGRNPGKKIRGDQNEYTLVDWVWMLHRLGNIEEAVDARLVDDYDVEEARKLLLLGLACSHPIASERPQTQAIVQIISGTLPAPNVPPFKPLFMWPSMATDTSDSNDLLSILTTSSHDPTRRSEAQPLKPSETLPV